MANPKKTPSRAATADTRERILEVAEDAFAYYGFSGASLQDIADRVGIKKASLFYYFKGKEDLYAEVIRRVFNALEGIFFPTVNETSAEFAPKIESLVGNLFDMMASHPNYARMLFRELLDNEERVAEVSGMLFGPLMSPSVAFLQRGVEAGQLKPLDPMHFIISLLGSITFYFVAGPLVEPHWRKQLLSPQVLKERRKALIEHSLNSIVVGR